MNKYFKIAMAAAMLFAVNMNADAQFGKLKKLANKAKETVTNTENTTVSNPVEESSEGSYMSPIVVENNGAKAAGGLDKYIGMTEPDEVLVYSYYKPGESDFRTGGKYDCGKTYGNMIAQTLVDMYRMIKSKGKMDLASCTPENLRDFYYGKPKGTAVVTGKPYLNDYLEHAQNPRSKYDSLRKGEQNVLMSKADADAFKRAAEKAKKAYEAQFGAIPKQ
ncbi:MAG: hypothetical protein IJG74_08665 [Prevotella sp.]|nr:hypothetical protein [Prevotella sp.]